MDNFKQKTQKIIELESTLLGSDINFKLKSARQKALKAAANQEKTPWVWYIPSTAMAALALYFVLPLLNINSEMTEQLKQEQTIAQEIIIDMDVDMELLDQLELVENLEFYEWLSLEDDISSI